MYNTILLALDLSPADRPIIEHVKQLASVMHSRIVLLHVASGPAAQFHEEDAGGKEVKEARAYLKQIRAELEASGIPTECQLAFGEPAREIIKWVDDKGCDLVAMGTHGHKLIGDLFFGATASKVQHNISVPVLLLRVP
ncbi:MAG TPA: universal stress protein [Lacipirellulaceae bacterium]|jgi:nucleotide-binding universal stress UspA family protein|nr:universal stress protein [Lacipirellulaceae bacterium]